MSFRKLLLVKALGTLDIRHSTIVQTSDKCVYWITKYLKVIDLKGQIYDTEYTDVLNSSYKFMVGSGKDPIRNLHFCGKLGPIVGN